MGKIEPMLKFKYSAKDNLYTMDLRRDVRPKDFKTMTFKPNISSKFIKRYNKFLIKEECIRRLDNCMDYRQVHKREWKEYIEKWYENYS